MQGRGHFIGGKWQQSGGAKLTSTNPATGQVLWEGCEATKEQIHSALEHGVEAFSQWKHTSFETRLSIVEAFKTIAQQRQEEIAQAISNEMGKVAWEAQAEAAGVVGKIDVSVKAYHERTGTHESAGKGLTNRLEHRPHGVMAIYGPYNFPAHLPNGHMVPALLAGNCVVLKPSELTPRVGELLVECWQEAGIPQGVVQLVQGARDVGIALSAHQALKGILFTGSVATGTALHTQAAGRLDLMLALELGGHNPLVVWDAGNTDAAVELIIQSAFITTGQRCTCARRLIIERSSASDTLLDALIEKSAALTSGAWDEASQPFMGPLVSEQAANAAMKAFYDLVARGGTPLLDMTQPHAQTSRGAFVTPGIVDITDVADAPDEEIFAPLLKIIRVDSFDAAIQQANNTRYGLSAGLLSDSPARMAQFKQQIHAGIVSINRPTTGASGAMPFGGVGVSGNHRPAAYYAADYCAYPVAMQITQTLAMPSGMPAGSAATK